MLERVVSNAVVVPPSIAANPVDPGGPLPSALRRHLEALLGADLSDIRVHVGPQAAALGARAFAMGSHLFFAPGQYDLESARGRQLLGHELAHVLQQRGGRVKHRGDASLAVVTDPVLEAEADRLGEHVAACWPVLANEPSARPPTSPPFAARASLAEVWTELDAWRTEVAVIQRAPSLEDLKTFSTMARGRSNSSAEVQAMCVKNAVLLTANNSVSTANFNTNMQLLTSEVFQGLVPQSIRDHTALSRPRDLKKAPTLAEAAEKAFSQGTIILSGGQEDLHAEQGLLIVLAHMMKTNDPLPLGDVVVGGRNAPCDSCRRVLVAFAGAYSNWGYGTLTFDTAQGQGRDRTRLNLRALFPSPGHGRFSNFLNQYSGDIAE